MNIFNVEVQIIEHFKLNCVKIPRFLFFFDFHPFNNFFAYACDDHLKSTDKGLNFFLL